MLPAKWRVSSLAAIVLCQTCQPSMSARGLSGVGGLSAAATGVRENISPRDLPPPPGHQDTLTHYLPIRTNHTRERKSQE